MTRAEIIKALESLEGPSREVADHVLLACGWKRDGRLWKSPQIKYYQEHERPNPLASIDSALTLGRTEDERREILGAIYDNANETYTIARCILFGCAHALRLREESTQ